MEFENLMLKTRGHMEVLSITDQMDMGTSSAVADADPRWDNWNKRRTSTMDYENLVFEAREAVEVMYTFAQMGIRKQLLGHISKFGFETPSAIHQKVLMPVIAGRDAIVQAQPGAEKMLIIAVAVCQRICTLTPAVQAVIVSPTPKLAMETLKLFRKMGDNLNVKAWLCDGANGEDIGAVEPGVHVLFGTPDAILLNMMAGKSLGTDAVKLLILDDSDEMPNKGFLEKFCYVYDHLPRRFQVVLLSATLSPEILTMGEKMTTYPLRVLANRERKDYYLGNVDWPISYTS